jgi:hypothetical protein
MNYSPLKTAGKTVPPLLLIVIARAAIAAAESHGAKIDESQYWTAATVLYGGFIAFTNWLKNRKKKSEQQEGIKSV